MLRRTTLLALLGAMSSALPVHSALFEGLTVRMSHDFPAPGSVLGGFQQDAVVGPGVEGTFFQTYYTIDVSDLAIDIAFTGGGTFDGSAFNGIHISDANRTIPGIGSVALGLTSFANFDVSRISFDSDNVYIDLRGLNTQGGETLQILAAPVPEPASYATMIVGLVGIGAATIKRNRERRTPVN